MGRGRQKAKHTKVARELKYFSPDTNYNALERELTGHPVDDQRLDEDLAKWPEYEASKPGKDDEDDEQYVDTYATDTYPADTYAAEDEQRRA